MDGHRLVSQALVAYVHGGATVPNGSLLEDCDTKDINELAGIARNRKEWRRREFSPMIFAYLLLTFFVLVA